MGQRFGHGPLPCGLLPPVTGSFIVTDMRRTAQPA